MKARAQSNWEIILRELYRMGGGPLSRLKFDGNLATEDSATYAVSRLKSHGLVTMQGHNWSALWTITQKGRDLCDGKIILVRGEVRNISETTDEKSRRHTAVLAGSDDAIESCLRLSAKQREALILVSKGFLFLEIAGMLNISHNGVAERIADAIRILGCTRTLEAVVLITKAGLV